MKYNVLVFSHQLSGVGEHVQNYFSADFTSECDSISATLLEKKYKALVLDLINEDSFDQCGFSEMMMSPQFKDVPVIVLTHEKSVHQKLKAFELGCDDYIEAETHPEEVCARIMRSIFHQIATEQLASRLIDATQTATNAISDNSVLGATIRFLVKMNDCDNLDELGQQFFSAVSLFRLSCSLQIRSELVVKNMEAHGMMKDLESQLLDHLKDSGRFIDFGRRTVINYDCVSLLIKNMPVDDPEKYGAIKDNLVWLVEGVNARVHALDNELRLQREHQLLSRLSKDAKSVIGTLKVDYQNVMNGIVTEVETVADLIHHRLPSLALSEIDESFMEGVTDRLISETNRIFNEGLKTDEAFDCLERTLADAIVEINSSSVMNSPTKQAKDDGDNVELF